MNGNSEVSADPVTDDQIRAAIYAADRSAKDKGRPGFSELDVVGPLSKTRPGQRPQIWRQVHTTVVGMLLDTGLDLSHSTVTLDYFRFADVAVTA